VIADLETNLVAP